MAFSLSGESFDGFLGRNSRILGVRARQIRQEPCFTLTPYLTFNITHSSLMGHS
jgi:hypothetical protein